MDFVDLMRKLNRFGAPSPIPIGNDMPDQSGIMGNMRPDDSGSDPSVPTSIFGNPADVQNNPIAQGSSITPQKDPLSGDYGISTPLMDAYRKQLLGSVPTRENPTILHRIFAGMAAMSPQTSDAEVESIKYPKYTKEKQAYDQRVKQLGEGAGVEERYVSNQRLAAASDSRAQRDKDKLQAAKDKSDKDYDFKEKQLQQQLDISNSRLEQAKAESQRKQGDSDAMMKYRDAEMAAVKARHDLDLAQRDRAADESKRLHDAQIDKMNKDNEATQARIKILEQNANTRQNPPDKTVTTTEDKPKSIFQKVEGYFGIGSDNSKSKTTTTSYQKSNNPDRQKAIDHLQTNGKPVTEANISFLLQHKGEW